MSEKSLKQTERRRAYKRSWRKARGQQKGISPVVATLILVLIAVAAAAALYIWLIGWQGGVTSTIGKPTVQQGTFTIGGSTSVYPFSQIAVQSFEQNNSGTSISDNQGGTGAGMLAVCAGSVDVGAASSLETAAGLVASDGCPSQYETTITITTVAYDAVDVIVPVANDHGLVSISYDTLTLIYDGTSTAPTLIPTTYNGQTIAAVPFDEAPFTTHAALAWSQVPAAVAGATVPGCTAGAGDVETVSTTAATGTTADVGTACGAPNANDFVAATTATATSCGFTICAGGTVAFPGTDLIKTVARSDASGTTQTFEARVLGATSATGFATTFSGLGFSGCGSNNLLSDCGITSTLLGNGNPGVISAVAGSPDSIGYASDGLARAATSGVTCEGIGTAACGIGLEGPGQTAAQFPSLGATGTIAAGIVLGGFGTPGLTTTATTGYAAARPFEYVTLDPAVGLIEQYFSWVTDPANNILFAGEAGEVSIYSI